MVTIFKNIFSKEPHYVSIDSALERIKQGKSKILIEQIRIQVDKDRADKLKVNLPSVCFSGKFGANRTDSELIEHSGFIVLDFDELPDATAFKSEISKNEYIYAAWLSPRGNGVKALVKISSGEKHREHFASLQEKFTGIDRSGVNVSRVCYESWDSDIYINNSAKTWTKTKKTERVSEQVANVNNTESFKRILVWLSNRGDAFVKGERNFFVFKLASACCRFGIPMSECESLSFLSLTTSNKDFSERELSRTIKSAYKASNSFFGTAEFTNEVLVDKVSRGEIVTKVEEQDIYNLEVKPKDVIYGEDVKGEALKIHDNGYEDVETMGIPELDEHFKLKRGEITLLTGHGNYGKSTFLKYILLVKIMTTGKKFAFFSPEENPAHEFYHDLVEMYLGQNMTPKNGSRPDRDKYEEVYDWISKHIFYVYPKDTTPTPDYIKERFLELVIKEKVDGCIIDPFNQLTNDYGSSGGRTDKYLETFLSDCSRFAQVNSIYFLIVAHPKMMRKIEKGDFAGNYPCPDVYDIADGAMWNNKMDNIIVFHRPLKQTEPDNTLAEFHSKKIRRQKVVGRLGMINVELKRLSRRFYFNGRDYIAEMIAAVDRQYQEPLKPNTSFYEVEKDDTPPF